MKALGQCLGKKCVRWTFVGLLGVLLLAIFFFFQFRRDSAPKMGRWERVTARDMLQIGVILNPMEYYISQGKISGFSYEFGQLLADSLGVGASYSVFYTYEEAYRALLSDEIDLLAAADVPAVEWEPFFCYTVPLAYTDVVLVGEKGKVKKKADDSLSGPLRLAVSLPSVLMGQAAECLLRDSGMALKCYMAVSDQLLQEVQDGHVGLTLAFGLYWRAYAYLFPRLEQKEVFQRRLPLCWVFRRSDDSLFLQCNAMLARLTKQSYYKTLLKKYTDPASTERTRLADVQQLSPFGSISSYDVCLQEYAAQNGLDWYLLAALIYQESRFNHLATGIGDTYGLMQFTPATAFRFGVHPSATPAQQIEGGCRYLQVLRLMLEKEGVHDSLELVPMMIAAYNAGSGHLKDAIALARLEGLRADVWEDNVEKALLMLADRAYNRKACVRNGSFHAGRHTIQYVQSVLLRREHYKALAERDSLKGVD